MYFPIIESATALNLCGEVLRMLVMALRAKRRKWSGAAFAVLLVALCTGRAETKHAAAATPAATPAASIAVGPLGYVAPSDAYVSFRLALATLDFIDDNRLLFTFHIHGLMQRIPGDPEDDEDQVIHADVLEIATGKVLRQTDWRMHDKQRYLWALQDGRFLVRQRNSLFLTNSDLELRPYLMFDTDLEAVEISPGRNLMLIELKKLLPPDESNTQGDASSPVFPSLNAPRERRQTRTEMILLRPGQKTVLGNGEVRNPMDLPLLEDGFLKIEEGKQPKQWLIEKEMISKETTEVGEVKSSCTPRLIPLNEDVTLAENCPVNGGDGNAVSALSQVSGTLWQGLWQSKYIWPTFDFAENGSRFAYESLQLNRQLGAFDNPGEADVVAQPVGVFDTTTGQLELVKNASPILSGGQNFALSADGRRFAILRDGAIEVYDLPPVPAKEPDKGKNEAKR
jgi:hypothetical protein